MFTIGWYITFTGVVSNIFLQVLESYCYTSSVLCEPSFCNIFTRAWDFIKYWFVFMLYIIATDAIELNKC